MKTLEGIENTYLFEHGGYITVVLGGLGILILTALVSTLLVRVMYRALNKSTGGEIGGTIIANIIRVGVWVIGLSAILKECFGIDATVLLGALGVGGIALSLGLQNTISNLIGGLQASLSREVGLGDWITVNNTYTGEVKDITWRIMKVRDSDGNEFIIPNSMLTSTAVTVLAPWQPVKIPLAFKRSANLDDILENVPRIASEKLSKAGYLHKDKDPTIVINGTAVDSIDATLVVYGNRTCSDSKVIDCFMPSVIDYLCKADAIAVCGQV